MIHFETERLVIKEITIEEELKALFSYLYSGRKYEIHPVRQV